jgi:hypothetical protein
MSRAVAALELHEELVTGSGSTRVFLFEETPVPLTQSATLSFTMA